MALARDPTRRATLGAEGRRRAETEFAAERINQETLRVYERALALSRATRGAKPCRTESESGTRRT